MTTAEKANRLFSACFFPCLGDSKPEESPHEATCSA